MAFIGGPCPTNKTGIFAAAVSFLSINFDWQ